MKWTMYDVNEKIDWLLDKYMDASTGELAPEATAEIEKLGLQRSDLIKGLALAVKRNNMYIAGMSNEKKLIDARIKSAERSSYWLLQQVKNNITEGETVKEDQYEIKWSTSTRLDIDEFERNAEKDYKTKELKRFINKNTCTTFSWDKSAISKFIKTEKKGGGFNTLQGMNITKTKNLLIK